jgi:predicted DCC family thiol-disulfide oxidoreductase YuxK
MNGTSDMALIYDGECPVCSAYSRALALRKLDAGFRLIDARSQDPLVSEVRSLGLDLNEGFVFKLGGEFHHGADAIHRLALVSSNIGPLNRLNYWVFRSPVLSKLLYPALKAGRNVLLAILGRKPIPGHKPSPD